MKNKGQIFGMMEALLLAIGVILPIITYSSPYLNGFKGFMIGVIFGFAVLYLALNSKKKTENS